MSNKQTVPQDGRGKKAKHDFNSMKVGEGVYANAGSAHYWTKKLKPKRFVSRLDARNGNQVWRVK